MRQHYTPSVKDMVLHWPQKVTCVQCGRMQHWRRQSSVLCDPAVNEPMGQLKFLVALHMSVGDCESIVNINLGVTNKF